MSRTRIQEHYAQTVVPALMKDRGYRNVHQVPRLDRIVINMGLGEGKDDQKLIDACHQELALITGQRPVVMRARKDVANFKLRKGLPVGVRVTLRRERMYEFFDRLVNLALPRVRDFRGVSPKSFDGRGNYTLGLTEQTIFLEVDFNKVVKTKGMNITLVTTARTDEEGRELLRKMGMPFRAN